MARGGHLCSLAVADERFKIYFAEVNSIALTYTYLRTGTQPPTHILQTHILAYFALPAPHGMCFHGPLSSWRARAAAGDCMKYA